MAAEQPSERPAAGWRAFLLLWGGQFVSLTGSAVTGFGLGVFVFQQTGSVTDLSVIYVLGLLPFALASPLAGAVVDRWGSRASLLASNAAAALVVAILALLLLTGTFALWQVYPLVAALSLARSVQSPALSAAMPLVVPPGQLGRANGLRMVALAISQVVAPAAGGVLLPVITLPGILVADVISFGLAIGTLLALRIAPAAAADRRGGPVQLLHDIADAWRHLRVRSGLTGLLIFLGALNFCAGFVDVLITPLVLSFADPRGLGLVLSVGGIGAITAGAALSIWGGPRRRVRGILLLSTLMAGATAVGGARPALLPVTVAAFVFLGALGAVIGINQTLWQTKVPTALLGRTTALQNLLTNLPQLLAYGLAGPLVDRVFTPLLDSDPMIAPVLSLLVGQGPGRGSAVLLWTVGVLLALSVGLAALHPRLRRLEDELPDVDPAASAGRPAVADRPGRGVRS